MKESKRVKVRRRISREIPLVGAKVPETKVTYRQETVSTPGETETPPTAESLSLALERDARRYSGLWEVPS